MSTFTYSINAMGMRLLLCGFAVMAAAAEVSIINRCPQLKEENEVSSAFYYGHPDNCQYFFACASGIPHLRKCPEQQTWSDFFQTCIGFNSQYDTCTRDNAKRECEIYPEALIPHPVVCQRYYNCSDQALRGQFNHFERYEDECFYPGLFDVHDKKCKPYKETSCGPLRNTVGKDPCDYLRNLCGSAHCQPCPSRLPSCVARTDGFHEHPYRLWSPYYIQCRDERLIESLLMCQIHEATNFTALFSPVKKACVSLWEIPREHGGLAPSCDGKADGYYRTDERADIYYVCPAAQVFYCGVGLVFHVESRQCQ